ncbi:BTB/POZ domain-containing protein 6-A-like [Contarinia nasturtii]|uniref:BTB/POZ domain-containing protein 6-A-like n=1 Tax=Contarinia nasturtii TaxID=265458 RepID=UPI0012D4ACBB|nr:BTB/POZ domain-containing protein 6-A-like [Contarinia nasturtii]
MSHHTADKRKNMSKQYLNFDTSDVVFICGNDDNHKESVPAHKFVLFTHSDVFEKMFHGSLPEEDAVEITDTSPDGFRAFLRYFYFDEMNYNISMETIGETMYLCEKYNVNGLFESCCQYLQQVDTPKHILIGYGLAITYELDYLAEILKWKILQRGEEIFACDYIRSVSEDFLKCILQIKYIEIYAKKIFDVCLAWAEGACNAANVDPNVMQNRRDQLNGFFQHIQFGAMTRDEIVRIVLSFGELFTAQELRRFIVITAAKFPTPFNQDEMINYKIGRAVKRSTSIRRDKMEELHFNAQYKTLLGGIEIGTIFDTFSIVHQKIISGVVSVVKISPNRDQCTDIVLLQGSFKVSAINYAKDHVFENNKILFPEAIIIEPHFKYAIQLTFFGGSNPTDSLFHLRTTSLSEPSLFRIWPEDTNCEIISGLLYNRLNTQ